MIRKYLKILIAVILALAPLLMVAQPSHPNQNSNPGGGNAPVGGGAPVGNGTYILITLAAAYAVSKAWGIRKVAEESLKQSENAGKD